MKTTHRTLARVAGVAVVALLTACSSSAATQDPSTSIVGTHWDGRDDFGIEYWVYFDPKAALRIYDVANNVWVNQDPNLELAWSQEGDVVTVYSTDLALGGTAELTGTVDGDHLYLKGGDDDYTWWLDLRRVE